MKNLGFSKCEPKTSNISMIWEVLWNGNYQIPLQAYWLENYGMTHSGLFEEAIKVVLEVRS